MKKALQELDRKLAKKNFSNLKLLIGGGGAFVIAYGIPIQTVDIDGIPFQSKITEAELDAAVKETAHELKISPDWLNPYFGTFLICLPQDYGNRLKSVLKGKSLHVFALGLTDLLIMKCFAAREKDMLHTKILIRKGADIQFAEQHLSSLLKKNYPKAQEALDFLIEAEEEVGK